MKQLQAIITEAAEVAGQKYKELPPQTEASFHPRFIDDIDADTNFPDDHPLGIMKGVRIRVSLAIRTNTINKIWADRIDFKLNGIQNDSGTNLITGFGFLITNDCPEIHMIHREVLTNYRRMGIASTMLNSGVIPFCLMANPNPDPLLVIDTGQRNVLEWLSKESFEPYRDIDAVKIRFIKEHPDKISIDSNDYMVSTEGLPLKFPSTNLYPAYQSDQYQIRIALAKALS